VTGIEIASAAFVPDLPQYQQTVMPPIFKKTLPEIKKAPLTTYFPKQNLVFLLATNKKLTAPFLFYPKFLVLETENIHTQNQPFCVISI